MTQPLTLSAMSHAERIAYAAAWREVAAHGNANPKLRAWATSRVALAEGLLSGQRSIRDVQGSELLAMRRRYEVDRARTGDIAKEFRIPIRSLHNKVKARNWKRGVLPEDFGIKQQPKGRVTLADAPRPQDAVPDDVFSTEDLYEASEVLRRGGTPEGLLARFGGTLDFWNVFHSNHSRAPRPIHRFERRA